MTECPTGTEAAEMEASSGQPPTTRPPEESPHSLRLRLASEDLAPKCNVCQEPCMEPLLPADQATAAKCSNSSCPNLLGRFFHLECAGFPTKASRRSSAKSSLLFHRCIRLVCPSCADEESLEIASAPTVKSDVADLKEQMALISSQVQSLSDFMASVSIPPATISQRSPAGRSSYAAAAAAALPPPKPTLLSAIASAQAKVADEEKQLTHRESSVLFAGIPAKTQQSPGQLKKLIFSVFDELEMPPASAVNWRALKRSSSRSEGSPPPIEVSFPSPAPAKHLLSSAARLKRSESLSHIFIRPVRSREENSLLRLRAIRAQQLTDQSQGASTFRIQYGKPGFPLLQLTMPDQQPNFDFVDNGWEDFIADQQKEDDLDWARRVAAAPTAPSGRKARPTQAGNSQAGSR